MPSPGHLALAGGYSVLRDHSAEPLTFRGATVKGLINRLPDRDLPPGVIDFSPQDKTEIEFESDAFATLPKPGESFVDENGQAHRIQTVKRLGHVILCTCHGSP